jgi:hypothetical protein
MRKKSASLIIKFFAEFFPRIDKNYILDEDKKRKSWADLPVLAAFT